MWEKIGYCGVLSDAKKKHFENNRKGFGLKEYFPILKVNVF
jgi:hypothetical protein